MSHKERPPDLVLMESQSREPPKKKTRHSEDLGDLGEPRVLFMYFVSRLILKRTYSGVKHYKQTEGKGRK